MNPLFAIQLVVLVVAGYLIGVGFFRRKWTVPVPHRERCGNPSRWAVEYAAGNGGRDPMSLHSLCEGPRSAVADPYPEFSTTQYCAECVEYAAKVHAGASGKDKAWAWPVVGIGKAAMAVVRIGESIADLESRS